MSGEVKIPILLIPAAYGWALLLAIRKDGTVCRATHVRVPT